METLFKSIEKNSFYIILIIIFISFLLININVVNFGDDYYFMQFKDFNFFTHIKKMFHFYCNDNGRFIVHLLVSFFIKMPIIIWQICNTIVLTGICFFIAKITSLNSNNKNLILIVSFFLLSSIEIKVTRQSIFWLTGSFNYIYPCIMLLIYTYLLTKLKNKKLFVPTLIFAFLSSASMEQSAMMTVGMTFLVLLSKFRDFKSINTIIKNNKELIIIFMVTILGACSVLLAPAQFHRIEIESQGTSLKELVIKNIRFILTFYTQSMTAFYYEIILLLSIIIYILQKEKKAKEKSIMLTIAFISILLLINLFFFGFYYKFLKYIYIMFLGICLFYFNKKEYNTLINYLTIAIVLFIGSQCMMIISPILGYRNFIFGLVSLLFIIGLIISRIKFNKYYIHFFSTILIISALFFNYSTAQGYYKNKLIHEKNIAIIENSDIDKNNSNNSITLYKYENDDYAWSMPYISNFHLKYFKDLYNIKCNIDWK